MGSPQEDRSTVGFEPVIGNATWVAVGTPMEAWCVNSAGSIYRYDPEISDWRQIKGPPLAQVAVASDGSVWGVNAATKVFRYLGDDAWEPVDGSLTNVSVGSATNVWGVNSAGQIYRYQGPGKDWALVRGSLRQVSVAADGTVWGVNSLDQIYRYLGDDAFERIDGSLVNVAVGSAHNVWGVNGAGQVYRYRGPGRDWELMAEGFAEVSVSEDGSVWLVDHDGKMVRQDYYAALALRFAPCVQFHPNETFFPCSIEHLLRGSTLSIPLLYAKASSEALGTGPGAVSFQIGDINGDGKAEIVQAWANGSRLGLVVYGALDGDAMQVLWSSDDMGQGPDAVCWLMGDINHDGKAELIQAWANGSRLGFIVYGAPTGNAMQVLWSSDDIGQGPGAVSWQIGDINGDGKAEIVQGWANGSQLGLIVYGAPAGNALQVLGSSDDVGQGPRAVSWLMGDINHDGKAELVQAWANGSRLGLIVYGAPTGNTMQALWSSDDMGQGPDAVCWQIGDINGDGKAEIVQGWANGSRLGLLVYGAPSGNMMQLVGRNDDVGEGSRALSWRIGDVNGDHKAELVQTWANESALGLVVYGASSGSTMGVLWSTSDVEQGPAAVEWFCGDVDADGRAELVQLWSGADGLHAITYGADESAGTVLIQNPTQADLAAHPGPGSFVTITESQYQGMISPSGEVLAPMYYAVESFSDRIELSFVFLYANQGGQTCRALRAGTEFNAIVHTYGEHQGDYERVVVRLGYDAQSAWAVSSVGFEAHGILRSYTPAQVAWDGAHPVVHSALLGHSSWNTLAEGDTHVEFEQAGIVAILDAMGDGVTWKPYPRKDALVRIGLTSSGQPFNQQAWSKFAGRLGRFDRHSLTSATHYDGSNLSALDWDYVVMVCFAADHLHKLPEDVTIGIGPVGPGARDYIVTPGRRPS